MSLKTSHIVIGSGVLVAGGLLWRLSRTAKHLEVVPRLRVHKLDFKNLTLAVDATLKNPTSGGLKIKFPFVKLIHEGTTVGSSEAKDEEIKIPPFGQSEIKNIMIEIPLLNLTGVAVGLVNYLRGITNMVAMDINVMTQADALITSFPVNVTEPVIIQRKQVA